METARLYYSQSPEPDFGRVSLWVLAKDASVGKPLDELPKIQVWVTLDGGHEDIEAYQQYGHSGLRRQKVLRISEEILEQVGIATPNIRN
ncbi:DUF1670 domain-containing protein [candidate division KSB1 bacterium]|nr:DUF1670 domain-containing protein [candidate division KSB1 bacterium]